ncbi:methyltransferase domain-containing protein [Globomyces pollinis-pini]|nr:methyltransferase domain-containing protein [Globomyces pollinis-pini]
MIQNHKERLEKVKELKEFINEFAWLSDFFAIDFITKQYWSSTFRDDWKILEHESVSTLADIVSHGFIKDSWPDSLKQYITRASNIGLIRTQQFHGELELDKEVKIGMKQKKVAEVTSISSKINDIAVKNKITHILDLGAGQGYLSSALAFQYHYHVIAIDRDMHQTAGGAHRANRIANLYAHHKIELRGSLRFLTESISTTDTMQDIFQKVEQAFPDVIGSRWMICGLHTCGDLAVTMIKGFCAFSEPNACSLVNLGCCYQLISEKPESCESDEGFGFPLSTSVKPYHLGLNNRLTGCQAVKRWASDLPGLEDSLRRLFYRSVLEQLMKDRNLVTDPESVADSIKSSKGEVAIKKLGVQACTDPITYTNAAFERLGIKEKLPNGIILGTYEWYSTAHIQIAVVWTLRTLLSNAVESLILLDRMIYVSEQNIDAELVSLADPSVSPRNMGVVIIKK